MDFSVWGKWAFVLVGFWLIKTFLPGYFKMWK